VNRIAKEIQAEQEHGRQKYGRGPRDFAHDDSHNTDDWDNFIEDHADCRCAAGSIIRRHETEIDQLKAQLESGRAAHNVDRVRADTLWRERDALKSRCAELEKDKQRLDWLSDFFGVEDIGDEDFCPGMCINAQRLEEALTYGSPVDGKAPILVTKESTLRDAIDAAVSNSKLKGDAK